MNLIDIHCHILPYVDDGAADLTEALELLQMEAQQGVEEISLTPHLRAGMFRSSDEKILAEFQRLQEQAEAAGIEIPLWLSREYYYDSDFCKRLEAGKVIPLGLNRTLLVEFSYATAAEDLLEAAKLVQDANYQPLFAHVERYAAIQKDAGVAAELVNMGVLLQMNASSILGWEGLRQRFAARSLLKHNYIHVIASDCHDAENRIPNLRKCADAVARRFDPKAAERLLYSNPHSLLYGADK